MEEELTPSSERPLLSGKNHHTEGRMMARLKMAKKAAIVSPVRHIAKPAVEKRLAISVGADIGKERTSDHDNYDCPSALI
jgi:hypothetical protein